MFCPECRVEYRTGFTHCTDCDVELVNELSVVGANTRNSQSPYRLEEFKRVWTGHEQSRCVEICKGLRAAGIPFRVDQHRRQYLKGVDGYYRIGVPAELFEKARKVIKGI